MKVALTFTGCHRRGGVERVMLETANFLADRGHETHVFSSEWDVSAMGGEIIRHHVPGRAWPSLFGLLTFSRNAQREMASQGFSPDVMGTFGVQSPPDGVLWMQSVHRAWLEVSRRIRGFKGRLKQRVNPFHSI